MSRSQTASREPETAAPHVVGRSRQSTDGELAVVSGAREPFPGPQRATLFPRDGGSASSERCGQCITKALPEPPEKSVVLAGATGADRTHVSRFTKAVPDHLATVAGDEGRLSGDSPAVKSEEWRPVERFPWLEVSSLGRVRHGSRILAPQPLGSGYLRVRTWAPGRRRIQFLVHVEVARAFIGPAPCGFELDHKNGDKADPALTNLEYVTHSENMLRSFRSGQHVPARGERHGMAKLDPSDVLDVIRLDRDGVAVAAIAGIKEIGQTAVYRILSGESWSHLTGLPRKPRSRPLPTPKERAA